MKFIWNVFLQVDCVFGVALGCVVVVVATVVVVVFIFDCIVVLVAVVVAAVVAVVIHVFGHILQCFVNKLSSVRFSVNENICVSTHKSNVFSCVEVIVQMQVLRMRRVHVAMISLK